jgi:hypothetical protein
MLLENLRRWFKDRPMRGPATDLDPDLEQGGNINVVVGRDPATGEVTRVLTRRRFRRE